MLKQHSRSCIRRLCVFLLLGSIATAGLAGQPSAAACDSLARCDFWQETLLFPLENRIVAGILPLRDDNGGESLRVYQDIIAKVGYEMPAEPAVGVYMVTVTLPSERSRPFVATDYREGNVSLRASYNGEEGWYRLGMPVNNLGSQSSGWRFGFPKYQATVTFDDTSPIGSAPAAATFQAKILGDRVTQRMYWREEPSATVSPQLRDFALFREPFFSRAEPHQGPDYWRSKLTPMPLVPLRAASDGLAPYDTGVEGLTYFRPVPGYVQVTLDADVDTWDTDPQNPPQYRLRDLFDPGDDLADIVHLEQTVAGTYLHVQENLLYQNKRLNRSEGCITPPATDPLYAYCPSE